MNPYVVYDVCADEVKEAMGTLTKGLIVSGGVVAPLAGVSLYKRDTRKSRRKQAALAEGLTIGTGALSGLGLGYLFTSQKRKAEQRRELSTMADRGFRAGQRQALSDQVYAQRQGRPFNIQAEYDKVKEAMPLRVVVPATGIALLGGVGAGHHIGIGNEKHRRAVRARYEDQRRQGRAAMLRDQLAWQHRGKPLNVQSEYKKMIADPTYAPAPPLLRH